MTSNVSSAVIGALTNSVETTIKNTAEGDTLQGNSLPDMTTALLAYSLDPIPLSIFSLGVYARLGLPFRTDIGFKTSGGVKIFDCMYQFMGPTAGSDESDGSEWYGSAGVQYSGQTYELPSFLGDFQKLLGYEIKRKDILIPVVFSRGFGPDEKYGAFSTGAVYNFSMVKYKYNPTLIYHLVETQYQEVAKVPQDEVNYSSYGLFVSGKAGYKFLYTILSLALYYQDYGEYNLLGTDKVRLSGITFVPTLSIQLAF
jgi:hypothetical protein